VNVKLVGIVWLAFAAGCWSSTPQAPAVVNRAAPPPVVEGVQYVGNPKASVSLTYYFDYECPPCAKFGPVLDEIERKYGNRIVVHYKNFQLSRHPSARLAAIAAEAARRQGKFIEMHRLLVEHARTYHDLRMAALQHGPAVPPEPMFTPSELREHAARLRLDLARFDRDVADPTAGARVDGEYAEGSDRGVTGVPGLFVGDKFHEGGLLPDDLSAEIDARLSP
jgi:protein-disulfide isomerase